MPTIPDLIRGTQKVLPTAINNFDVGSIKIDQLKITNFAGLKTKQFNALVRSSKGKSSYTVNAMFTGVTKGETPSLSKSRALVRCSCQSYFFWCAYANKKAKALLGGRLRKYIRKTPVSDPRYPPKNPRNVPMACKHVIFLSKALRERGLVK